MPTDFSEQLYYDETSPTCLRWKADRYKGRGHCQKFISAGDVAGCINGAGYYQVSVNRKTYLAHRVVYEIHSGITLQGEIDHINRSRTDNRIINLRVASKSHNQHNRCKNSNNTSGYTGVVFYTVKDKGKEYYYYKADGKVLGITKTKSFSVKKFGLLPAFALACAHRDNLLTLLNSGGANFTASHGK